MITKLLNLGDLSPFKEKQEFRIKYRIAGVM